MIRSCSCLSLPVCVSIACFARPSLPHSPLPTPDPPNRIYLVELFPTKRSCAIEDKLARAEARRPFVAIKELFNTRERSIQQQQQHAMSSSASSNKSYGNDRHAYDTPTLSAFTSGDAHNGCRALFNGTAGWAYIGPAGMIDPNALPPGTVSYSCDAKSENRGLFAGGRRGNQSQHDGAPPGNAGGGEGGHAAKRPGEGLGRKLNDARMAYLDADDLQHLVHEAGELRFGGDVDGDGSGRCGDGEEGAGVGQEEGRPSRKGRPIVLTLQAIFAATSPGAAAAAARTDDESNSKASSASNSSPAGAAAAAAAPPVPVAVADHAQFPPLMLRGASAEKGPGLFLAPPITMVKNETTTNTTTTNTLTEELVEEDSPDEFAEMSGGGSGDGGSCGRVSCSEAVAATSVAEGQSARAGEAAEGGTAGGMSRIGWWLRWATTTTTTTPSGVDEHGVDEHGEADGGVSLETSNGIDGWQVVSSSAGGGGGAGGMERQAGEDVDGSGAAPRERDEDDDDDNDDDEVGSWCDFAAEEAGGDDIASAEEDGGVSPAGAAPQRAATDASESDIKDSRIDNPDTNDTISADSTVPLDVSPNLPRSFRDMLMAPSASGSVRFSDSKALLRAHAAAGPSSTLSSGPVLVDGGANGGAVFLWRKAAAGEGEVG